MRRAGALYKYQDKQEKGVIQMLKTFAVTAVAIGLVVTLGLIGVVQRATALDSVVSAADFPKLATVLFQLSQAADPAEFAEGTNLEYAQGWVQVIIELQKAEAVLDGNYHLAITAESGNFIRTFVPVSELLRLALDSNVLLILPIYKPSEAQKI
jgi:hypothetical protein